MPIDWTEQTYNDHYSGRVRWADASDPIPNNTGQRIGTPYNYGADFFRYIARGPAPYWYYMERIGWIVEMLLLLGLQVTDRIIVVGSGFGYFIYCFRKASTHPNILGAYPNCWGVDSGLYISQKWDLERLGDEAYVDIDWTLNDTKPVQDELDLLTGGHTFDVVINHVTESYDTTNEVSAVNDMFLACERGLTGLDKRFIVHIVDNPLLTGETGQEKKYDLLNSYNTSLHTLPDWATYKSSHTWFDGLTGKYILGV